MVSERSGDGAFLHGEQHEPTVALNPLTGLGIDDIGDIARRTALQGARQPLLLGRHLAGHGRKLVDILAGDDVRGADAGDQRFRDAAWRENGAWRRLLQAGASSTCLLPGWRRAPRSTHPRPTAGRWSATD